MSLPRRRSHAAASRRGVTLLEMLVTVALLLLMMLVIVSIFQAATGAVTVSRAYTLLDQDLRRLNTMLRQDLSGVTCKMTPPNNPADNLGYFEYAENALSDAQDEDSDDTLRFTARADPDHPFTGRMWVPRSIPASDAGYATGGLKAATLSPIPVTSQYAEIIYFQRGSKLYRRVRLILPHASPIPVGNYPSDPPAPGDTSGNRGGATQFGLATNLFEPYSLFHGAMGARNQAGTVYPYVTVDGGVTPFVGWQALNDVSARPSSYDTTAAPANQSERSYRPLLNDLGDLTDRQNRFASPRFANDFRQNGQTGTLIPDGVPDDSNINGGDGVPDYYPTLYFNSKNAYSFGNSSEPALANDSFNTGADPLRPLYLTNNPAPSDIAAFPFVFPGPFAYGIQGPAGLIHAPDPNANTNLRSFNHNPQVEGDSLAVPVMPGGANTWWGFPTWRETAAPTWLDPIKRINDPPAATFFKDPIASTIGEAAYQQARGLSEIPILNGTPFFLPPQPDQPFNSGLPTTNQDDIFDFVNAPVFEDDLIADNVQSFNIKAFDPNPKYYNSTAGRFVAMLPGYYDLGYISGINPATGAFDPSYKAGINLAPTVTGTNPYFLDCLGHEGRIPPLVADFRVDPQFPTYYSTNSGATLASNLGDDNQNVIRLRRVWDSWSTTYSVAPGLPINPMNGPLNGGRATVPSYPAPYPVGLRGIEIQIRLVDPDSKYVKTLTIRQDFTEKL